MAHKVDQRPNHTTGAIPSALNDFFDQIRSVLPYPLNQFDSTGLCLAVYLVVSVLIHLIGVALSDTSKLKALESTAYLNALPRLQHNNIDVICGKLVFVLEGPDVVDRRMLHDCQTVINQQNVTIETLRKQALSPEELAQKNAMLEDARQRCHRLEQERTALQQK